jgi:hypothetical protein
MTIKTYSPMSIHISDIEDSFPKNDIFLPPNQKFKLLIKYPCKGRFFEFTTGKKGMNSFKLIQKIGKAYRTIYEDPGANGVWGHGIGDLYIEGIEIDFEKKLIELHVGS